MDLASSPVSIPASTPVLELQLATPSRRKTPTTTPRTLFSNDVTHFPDALLPPERCAFVRCSLWPGQIAVYSKNTLAAVTLLAPEIAACARGEVLVSSDLVEAMRKQLAHLKTWKTLLAGQDECYRLVHGEADGLPGIILDIYGSLAVVQSASHAGDFLLPWLVAAWQSLDPSGALVERSLGQARAMANLPLRQRTLFGTCPQNVNVRFAGLSLEFVPERSQKTGLFLDQRKNLSELVQWLPLLAQANHRPMELWRMLDLCCYAGAWSATAARLGCRDFVLVDQDMGALELAKRNVERALRPSTSGGHESPGAVTLRHCDLFEELQGRNEQRRSSLDSFQGFDLVVADPPAFARSKKNLPEAERAYARMVRLAAPLVRPGGLLVVCSCSRPLEPSEFETIVERTLLGVRWEQGQQPRWMRLHSGQQSADHTMLAGAQGSSYLKCLMYRIVI
jgi:23S rRNA (cytosine1962-C5)-methyltransferase